MTTYTTERRRRVGILVTPLVLVNASAIWGQAGWAFEHITDPRWWSVARFAAAVAFALAIESIGVYLAYEAHEALMADESAGLLRMGSYGVGILAGTLNYLHWADSPTDPTSQAVAFAALSAVSPWLWAIWSRARNRTRRKAMGLVDARGVKLSTSRKFWHPIRSIKVISWAAWEGITDPAEAVRGWELTRSLPEAPVSPATERRSKAALVSEADRISAENPSLTQLEIARILNVSDRWLREARRSVDQSSR